MPSKRLVLPVHFPAKVACATRQLSGSQPTQSAARRSYHYLDGDCPAREIREAIDTLTVRMADARRKSAEYGVEANLHETSAAELRRARKDYSVAWRQSAYRGLIRGILVHPATRPFNVWNPDRVEVLWR